jgi:gamma-glutamyl phosphate reductase
MSRDQEAALEAQAKSCREAGRSLLKAGPEKRADIIRKLADLLVDRADDILEANSLDLEAAKAANMTGVLVDRLGLTKKKLETLAEGLRQIADGSHGLIGRVIRA